MQIDFEEWQRLLRAEADAAHDGPSFLDVQQANGRWMARRDELARFKAAGPQGRAEAPPTARGHAGDQILPGVGGTGYEGVTGAFDRDVRELEARATAAESEAKRLADRHQQCARRRAELTALVEDCRTWARENNVLLPGDEGVVSSPTFSTHGVRVPEPPPGTRTFLDQPSPRPPASAGPAARPARGGVIARMLGAWS